jgi:hypothetical protein
LSPKPLTENCLPNSVNTKIAPIVGVASRYASSDEDDRDLKRPVL